MKGAPRSQDFGALFFARLQNAAQARNIQEGVFLESFGQFCR